MGEILTFSRLLATRAQLMVVFAALFVVQPLAGFAQSGSSATDSPASHGLAMQGAPSQAADFAHLSYADPAAPQGGGVVLGEVGAFDSLNPFAQRGRAPWHLRFNVFESLLIRSWDEPFTLYGLLAESVYTPPDRSYVEFELREGARFSNGDPVTVEDIIWTWATLKDEGRVNLQTYYDQVAAVEKVGGRGVRFTFKEADRELPLLIGLMPILPKSVYEARDFETGDLETPVGSGPYVVERVDDGRGILYRKDPDYWGADLAVNAGRHNFETIEHLYFGGASVMFEAFIAGSIDLYADSNPAHWADAYDAPPVADGRILKVEIPHRRPSGMRGFVFNTRRALFADRRVREAIALAFDFEWVDERFYRGGFDRIESFFFGSELGFVGPATGEEATLLAPFADQLPAGALEEGWRPPQGAGDGRNRKNLRRARALLEEAGWTLQDGVLRNAEGRAFEFEILLSSAEDERVAKVLRDALSPLGIAVDLRLVDQAQYTAQLVDYDYDMMMRLWVVSLSPGQEQRFYWGSEGRVTPGTRNYMGVADPAIDAMIDALLEATTRESFVAATRALDRVLSSGIYVIPLGYLQTDRVAHASGVKRPAQDPLYGYVYIDTWWREAE